LYVSSDISLLMVVLFSFMMPPLLYQYG